MRGSKFSSALSKLISTHEDSLYLMDDLLKICEPLTKEEIIAELEKEKKFHKDQIEAERSERILIGREEAY